MRGKLFLGQSIDNDLYSSNKTVAATVLGGLCAL